MLISRNWLQSYFENELPDAETIANTLMLHSFEIEGIEKKDNDEIIDIDVLPNRAHDCLSHIGIAREYAALTGFEMLANRYHYHDIISENQNTIEVTVNNDNQCYRYMARIIENIQVQPSPEWLRNRIQSISQRSINNIVDATNYIMFDTGNPIHVFDADKISGGITVRNAMQGELMMTLSGEEIELQESDLVIADNEGILALAGVKGGTKAEVDENTRNIVLEVANFNPSTTRSTARRTKILTDASKRFENEISSEIASFALESASRLISDIAHTENIALGDIVDIYPHPEKNREVSVSLNHIQSLLGLDISSEEILLILEKLNFQNHFIDMVFTIHIPAERLDLIIAEDIIEEIGRVYGYHNIQAKSLDEYNFTPEVNKQVFIEQTLRNFLVNNQFSDIMTYSFVKKGDIEMFNPIASDKKALRKNLYKQVHEALEKNLKNVDYFGFDQIKIFEIGRVYTKDNEETVCSIAIANNGKSANKKYGTERSQLEEIHSQLNELFSVEITGDFYENTFNFSLNAIAENITISERYNNVFSQKSYSESAIFHSVSSYPYTTRDVSFWASDEHTKEILENNIHASDTLFLKKVFLFDTFEKEGRKSYAFSLIFQSDERTLTDSDVDQDVLKITKNLESIGCEMR